MCTNNLRHDRIRCIIPPYINDRLMTTDDNDEAKSALDSQKFSSKIRAKREFIASHIKTFSSIMAPKEAKAAKKATLNMEVYDIRHNTDPALATLLWRNGEAQGKLDKDAKNVIKAGRGTWNFYYELFGRNSLNKTGLLLKHYIHFGKTEEQMDNAFWDGEAMLYGDGDARVFGSFTSDIDIIGHELTHGITQYESNLEYINQSGALNESLSDVFGIMIKQRMMNQDVIKSNWFIGENVLLGNQYALRSLKAPGTAFVNHPELGTDPQPATMDHYKHLPITIDGGGVHYNSGIPNFAFYVTAYNIGGFSWEKAGRIWYEAMTDKTLKTDATFEQFKNLTIKKASALFGAGSKEHKATQQGWKEAKV
jgi:Zn-dependent metalloprotease